MEDETRDEQPVPERTRRRLLGLVAWVPVGIVSLTAARAHAGRQAGTVKGCSVKAC
jgi:hypothetical protein